MLAIKNQIPLICRQTCEYHSLQRRRNMAPSVLQNSIVQLNLEHRRQREHMKAHHRSAYQSLCETWNNRLKECVDEFKCRRDALDEQITQIQDTDNLDLEAIGQYGPPVMVKLRKAPCKATGGKHSVITMCLSAGIAQAISLEDDIYDHFYTYKKK